MNSSGSLQKYAPKSYFYNKKNAPWRVIRSTEGLQYVATAMMASDPSPEFSHLMVRVNLGMSDASISLTNRIKSFFKALRLYKNLKALDLSHCQISDHTCLVHIASTLQHCKNLEILKLDDNAFTDKGASQIFATLNQIPVSVLSLSRNQITGDSMGALKKVIITDQLKSLDLSHTLIGAQGVKTIVPGMYERKKLKKLVLENARIGDEGCIEVANGFKNNKLICLEELNLAENHIGRVGIENLLSKFERGKNENLKALNLSKNYFGDEGFQLVIEVLMRHEAFTTLKLNKVGVTRPKFVSFCEKMQERYEDPTGPYPDLENFDIGNNGLGNEMSPLFDMLKQKNCIITDVNYEGNEVTTHGVKLLKKFLVSGQNKREGKVEIQANDPYLKIKEKNMLRRKNLTKFSLKSNALSADDCEHIGDIIKKCPSFLELDMRKNKVGLKGAIFLKKAFRKIQCCQDADFKNRCFKLHILIDDVGIEGANHLLIGLREHPNKLRDFIKSEKSMEYERPVKLQNSWNAAVEEKEEKRIPAKVPEEEQGMNVFARLSRPHPVDKSFRHHLGHVGTKFTAFNTPFPSKDNINVVDKYKTGILLWGENDEKNNVWELFNVFTYFASGVLETDRGILKWSPGLWGVVKQGFGAALGNVLHRHGMLLRLQYERETDKYIQDLYLQRYGINKGASFMREVNKSKRRELTERMVNDDTKEFWEILSPQSCKNSEGLTMFEFAVKYAKKPGIDCVRQFLNIFPAVSYANGSSKRPAVFLQQVIAQSGRTYRDVCLESEDPNVRRYAEAKKLILFRFLEVEPLYVTKFLKISKVEDLLLTEEYNDDERFFLMRRIAGSSAQEDEKLAANEFDAHHSFMGANQSYLSDSGFTSFDKIDNLIMPNENMNLDVEFAPQISQLFHRKQLLSDDKLMPTFTKIYKTTLREVLDNEFLGGGRDLLRTQIMLRMVANSLDHFNRRDWTKKLSGEIPKLVKDSRIHGNVKPRNIILRVGDELPDLYNGVDLMPAKWVLSDFSRSTKHKETYLPIAQSAYNPPEVAKRSMSSSEAHLRESTEAAESMDVWQFGCIMYEVLAGAPLFKTEGNTDLIVDERERGELINWLSLDDERASLILNQLKANRKAYGGHSLTLNHWGNYDDEEVDQIIKSGTELVRWCLQGRPDDRPTFAEILAHPFLVNIDVGRQSKEKDSDVLVPVPTTKFANASFLRDQPHMHLINTEFEQAGVIVKSLEHSLNSIGCRLTTDSTRGFTAKEYETEIKSNVQSARVVACILTKGCFYKSNVVKQLLFAEDYRKKTEKPHGRILFIDLGNKIDLSKDDLTWKKDEFRNDWYKSDEFQYMVKALAEENPSLKNFSLGQSNYDDRFDAWNKFMNNQFRAMVLSYLQDPIKYESVDFLKIAMMDRMLVDGHLVPSKNITSFSFAEIGKNNLVDPSDLLNKKLEDRKDKFMNLYFLPAAKMRTGNTRVYVLTCGGGAAGGNANTDETFNAVSEIARALEAPDALNIVSEENRHKDGTDPRNRILNKVKTSFNIKKDSHLKVGGRITKLQIAKDAVMNVTRKEGPLLVVLFCKNGVFKRYSKFLKEAVSERGDDFALVLVKGLGFDLKNEKVQKEIDENVPEEYKDYVKDSTNYLPYFKPKKDPWQYEASMKEVLKEAINRLENPTPSEIFTES